MRTINNTQFRDFQGKNYQNSKDLKELFKMENKKV